jgi:uncharacterized RDD family membrane protein YckC
LQEELVGDATKARFFAMVIDNLVAACLAFSGATGLPEQVGIARVPAAGAIYLLYYFLQEGALSTTLGKRVCGLVVRHQDGSRAGWKAATIRIALRVVEVNPILLGALPGALFVAMTNKRQRIGDALAGTVVARTSARAEGNGGVQRSDAAGGAGAAERRS